MKISIFDTTLRDGEQSAGTMLRPEEKLQIAKQLEKLGVDVIEAGFPVSSPGDFKAVSLVAKEIKGPVIAALCRCLEKDVRITADALKGARKSRILLFLPSSDIHLKNKLKKTRAEALEMAKESIGLAKSLAREVEYCLEDATRSDFEYLVKTVKTAIAAGAQIIDIADTVGYAAPEEFGQLIAKLRQRVPALGRKIGLSAHCHNDLGLAVANSLAAVISGANQVEGTINGVGERAGNAALEEIIMVLKTRKDLYGRFRTGINQKEIKKTSQLVSELLKIPIQPNKAIVGKNAFSHSSGIHQDGVLKHRQTYEIMRPEDIGEKKNEIILTARSGRAGLKHKLRALGFAKLAEEKIEEIYRQFIELADSQRVVTDQDLRNIVLSI